MASDSDRIHLRAATRDDVDALIGFNAAMALETENKTLDTAVLGRGVRGLLNHPDRGTYVVAEIDGDVVGQIMWTYEWSDWRNGHFWWIQSVYVHPDWRRRGVFQRLFRHVEQKAMQSGEACGLRLYVDDDNVAAQKTYVALGATRTDYKLMEWTFSDAR